MWKDMWNMIKKSPGTVVIAIAVIVSVIVVSIFFPERSQLITTLGVLALVPIVTFRIHKVAGWVVTCLMLVAVAFWVPATVQEYKRANDPNGTFADYFAKAKEQTDRASGIYKPGAVSQASLLAGVMSVDAKLSVNYDDSIVKVGSTINTNQLTLDTAQVESLLDLAGKIKENQQTFSRILTAGGVTGVKQAQNTSEVTVDLTDPDGTTIVVPPGMEARLSIVQAKYVLNKVFFVDQNGTGRAVVDFESDGNGQPVDDPDDRFVAPAIARYATIYKNGGDWQNLNMGETVLVPNRTGSPKEVVVTVNDIRGTYDSNKGTLVVRCELVPAPVELASTY